MYRYEQKIQPYTTQLPELQSPELPNLTNHPGTYLKTKLETVVKSSKQVNFCMLTKINIKFQLRKFCRRTFGKKTGHM